MMADPQYMLALELQKTGSSTAPVQSPIEGLSRMLTGALGSFKEQDIKQDYAKQGEGYSQALNQLSQNQGLKSDELVNAMLNSPNNYVRDMGEEAYGQMIAAKLKEGDSPIKVGKGETLLDPRTFKPIFSAPSSADPTTRVTVNKDGTVTYENGTGLSSPLSKPTVTNLEKKVLDTTEQLARLKGIESSFNPKYLGLPNQLKNEVTNLQDRVFGDISDERADELAKSTEMRMNVINNLNEYIRDITGATVGQGDESKRLKSAVPTMEDGKVVFQSKLRTAMKLNRAALQRQHYALRNGLAPTETGYSLDEVPKLVNKRGAEIEREIRQSNPGLSNDMIKKNLQMRLKEEFGG